MTRVGIWALAAVALTALAAPPSAKPSAPAAVTRAGRVAHPALDELSGFARSSSHPGIYWAHNDGDDEPRLFALRADGSVHVPAFHEGKKPWPGTRILGASNVDWEDIALANGVLYVADVGNNFNVRRDLGVYVVNEPHPDTAAIRALRFIPIVYPEQTSFPGARWEFDCEAVFADRGALYFLTKHRQGGDPNRGADGSHLYRLRSFDPDRENALERVSTQPSIRLASGASLSPSGARLAVLTHARVWIFERPARGDDWFAGKTSTIELPQSATLQPEAIAWIDDATLLVGSEDRTLLRVAVPGAVVHPNNNKKGR